MNLNTKIISLLLFFICSGLLVTCAPPSQSLPGPSISDIQGIKQNEDVLAGTTIVLYFSVVGGPDLTIEWQDMNGPIANGNTTSLVYTIPQRGGEAFITVVVTDKNGKFVTTTTEYQIIVPTATPTETLTPSITPESTLTSIFTATLTPIPLSIETPNPISYSTLYSPLQTPDSPYVIIRNELMERISIYIEDTLKSTIEPLSVKIFVLESIPAKISWNTERDSVAEIEIGSTFVQVNDGAQLIIDNIINQESYFYPILSNNTENDCEITINDGYVSKTSAGVIKAHTTAMAVGYYQLLSNSNVTLNCAGQLHWWGINPEYTQEQKSMTNFVLPGNGILILTLNP